MGAQESRSQQEADNDGITPQDDYYTILEVDENATADEIRVSISPLQEEGRSRFSFSLTHSLALWLCWLGSLFLGCNGKRDDSFVATASLIK